MKSDVIILRELGKRLSEIATLPIQQEKKRLWIANNDLKPIRPMVYIDQLPWHEINKSEEMHLLCVEPFLRSVEYTIRQLLYRWNHFPCDMVVENRIDIPMSVHNFNYGINIVENIRITDEKSDIVSHQYADQISTSEQLNTLRPDEIWVDTELDSQHLALCNEIFNGILPVRLKGVEIHAGIWDRIAQMRPAEKILWDIVDDPEFIEETVKKFVELTMSTVDQCEALGLLDAQMQYVHCTGAYTNDLPPADCNLEKPRAKDCWAFGMAQLLATVSPAMHDEFEIELVKPLYERFGLLYYGCCEPLQSKIDIIRKIKNVRKISISPWAKIEESAQNIGKDFVFSSKINPAFIAAGWFDKEGIQGQIGASIEACRKNSTPLELILKDVSTVSYRLDYLDQWNKLAMEFVQNA